MNLEEVHAQIQTMNYMIGALSAIVSAFGIMIWHFMRAEQNNMKEAIKAIEDTIKGLEKQNAMQSTVIKILARQTGVEIGD